MSFVPRRHMKTKGEIEAAISHAIVQFEIDYMGRGPKETRTHIVEDLVVVRLKGVLTPAEEQLSKSIDGKELVKKMLGPSRAFLASTAFANFLDWLSLLRSVGLRGLAPKAIKALRLSIAETSFSGFRNRHYRRMFQFAVQRNRVEPLDHVAEIADDIYLVLLLHFRGDHRRREE